MRNKTRRRGVEWESGEGGGVGGRKCNGIAGVGEGGCMGFYENVSNYKQSVKSRPIAAL